MVRIFATYSDGSLVVRLGHERAAVVASGRAQPLDPGAASLLNEWVVLAPEARGDWIRLVREGCDFVREGPSDVIRGDDAERGASA